MTAETMMAGSSNVADGALVAPPKDNLLLYDPGDPSSLESMIKVENVSMVFNVANRQLNTLKEYAIALSRRELRFKEFRALDNVSIDVRRGDVFGILGTNGSGKSTLLKIIAGVLDPTEGRCEVNGNIAPLIELGAGFDFELTARENIYLNGALLGYSKSFVDEKFDEIVEFADVGDFLDMPVKNYSSGMVARIAFAIATVIVPEILIVDEVLSVGDFMFQQKCEQRIQSLIKEHGVTVLIVSHSNEQIERLCNKAAWIEKGHLRALGKAADVCQIYRTVGGRPGSRESERKVLESMAATAAVPLERVQRIYGDDGYSTAIKLNSVEQPTSKTVAITNIFNEREGRIAAGLASALDAHFLTTRSDALPDVLVGALDMIEPERIVVLGNADSLSPAMFDEYRKAGVAVDFIEQDPRGLDAYRYVIEQGGAWGDAAVLAAEGSGNTLLSLAPFAHERKAPVLYVDGGMRAEELRDVLGGFRRVVLALPPSKLASDVADMLETGAWDVVSFGEGDSCEVNGAVNEWLRAELGEFDSVLVTAADSDIDNRPAAPFAGRTRSLVYLVDLLNLDHVADVLHRLEVAQPPSSLYLLGAEGRFSAAYRDAFARAAFLGS